MSILKSSRLGDTLIDIKDTGTGKVSERRVQNSLLVVGFGPIVFGLGFPDLAEILFEDLSHLFQLLRVHVTVQPTSVLCERIRTLGIIP